MKRAFHLKTPSGPFKDPFLYLRFFHTGRAVLFDLGDLAPLTARDLLRVSDVFVSHTHMDHFVGFDRLLRTHLHRSGILRIYGPTGFLNQVEGKLSGYTWNLTGDYPLSILAVQTDGSVTRAAVFSAKNGFKREDLDRRVWNGIFLDEARFKVTAAVLDHGVPCLGYRLEEKMSVGILSGELLQRKLLPGTWITTLKTAVVEGQPPSRRLRVKTVDGIRETTLGELEGLYRIRRGATLSYVVDVDENPANLEKIVTLARDSDLLYIEAAFAARDSSLARERKHLTAEGAGRIAARAHAAKTRVIHLSPRNEGREDRILKEVMDAAGKGSRIERGWKS